MENCRENKWHVRCLYTSNLKIHRLFLPPLLSPSIIAFFPLCFYCCLYSFSRISNLSFSYSCSHAMEFYLSFLSSLPLDPLYCSLTISLYGSFSLSCSFLFFVFPCSGIFLFLCSSLPLDLFYSSFTSFRFFYCFCPCFFYLCLTTSLPLYSPYSAFHLLFFLLLFHLSFLPFSSLYHYIFL